MFLDVCGVYFNNHRWELIIRTWKTKRNVEKEWRNKAATTDTVELNGITYQIDGEHLAFMCDLVDAQVHHYDDGSWEIISILGKHNSDE